MTCTNPLCPPCSFLSFVWFCLSVFSLFVIVQLWWSIPSGSLPLYCFNLQLLLLQLLQLLVNKIFIYLSVCDSDALCSSSEVYYIHIHIRLLRTVKPQLYTKVKTKRMSKIYKSQYIFRYNILTVKLQSVIREMRSGSCLLWGLFLRL